MMKEKVAEGLKTEKTRTPKFCLRPYIPKRGNPARPVISSVNCHTSNILKYVDYVKEIPSYVKDTKDFIQKLNQREDSLLVTLDVKSLYTNISNNEEIKAVKEAYDEGHDKTVPTKVITNFLSLILTLNDFIFNSVNYIQEMGCAMGTLLFCMSLKYASSLKRLKRSFKSACIGFYCLLSGLA